MKQLALVLAILGTAGAWVADVLLLSVHQPFRKDGTVSRRKSATQTPIVARIARTWRNGFIA